ncbi:MAG: dTDP-glucose 4,6-dehydratase [Leptolinea sp.]|jgi:dTDP-glucose 4,6-dehydratase|nr:dTDP-glucose 4,6-dehydratase [Leptolinea sp.]
MLNWLVTGGAGFIGSNFIQYILSTRSDINIINFDLLTYAGNLNNLKTVENDPRYTFVQGDICDRQFVDAVLRDYAINTIVHFAAESHVDRSILGPMQFVKTNVIGTATLLDAARDYWSACSAPLVGIRRFHHISTDEVFGSLKPGEPAWTEDSPYAPNSPYAASKAGSDHLVRAYGHTYGMPVSISNCSNNYGPFQFPEKLIPLVTLNALNGKALPVYGDGQQIRDWLYVEDHCEAITRIITDGRPGETYNIGGNNQPANLEIVRTICRLLDEMVSASKYRPHESLITFVQDRPGHDRRYAMDSGKLRQELGWAPRYSLEEGLRKTVRWYLDHQEWVEQITDRTNYQDWMQKNYDKRGGTVK